MHLSIKVKLLFLQKPLMLGRSQARVAATFAYRGFRGQSPLGVGVAVDTAKAWPLSGQ